jgi:hypothetical protein
MARSMFSKGEHCDLQLFSSSMLTGHRMKQGIKKQTLHINKNHQVPFNNMKILEKFNYFRESVNNNGSNPFGQI